MPPAQPCLTRMTLASFAERRCSERMVTENRSSKISACRSDAIGSVRPGTLDVALRMAGSSVHPDVGVSQSTAGKALFLVNITFPATNVPAIGRARRKLPMITKRLFRSPLHEHADPAQRVLGASKLPPDSDELASLLATDPGAGGPRGGGQALRGCRRACRGLENGNRSGGAHRPRRCAGPRACRNATKRGRNGIAGGRRVHRCDPVRGGAPRAGRGPSPHRDRRASRRGLAGRGRACRRTCGNADGRRGARAHAGGSAQARRRRQEQGSRRGPARAEADRGDRGSRRPDGRSGRDSGAAGSAGDHARPDSHRGDRAQSPLAGAGHRRRRCPRCALGRGPPGLAGALRSRARGAADAGTIRAPAERVDRRCRIRPRRRKRSPVCAPSLARCAKRRRDTKIARRMRSWTTRNGGSRCGRRSSRLGPTPRRWSPKPSSLPPARPSTTRSCRNAGRR